MSTPRPPDSSSLDPEWANLMSLASRTKTAQDAWWSAIQAGLSPEAIAERATAARDLLDMYVAASESYIKGDQA